MKAQFLSALLMTALLVSCGSNGKKPRGWYLLTEVKKDGQRARVTESGSFMLGFNEHFQIYSISGDFDCNGVEFEYSVDNGRLEVDANETCNSMSADYSLSGSELTFDGWVINGKLIFDEAIFEKIDASDAQEKYRSIPKNRGGNPKKEEDPDHDHDKHDHHHGYTPSTPTEPKTETPAGFATMAELNGFWQLTTLSYAGEFYRDGDKVKDTGTTWNTEKTFYYFKDGKFIKFRSGTAHTDTYLNFEIKPDGIHIPSQLTYQNARRVQFYGENIRVFGSIDDGIMMTDLHNIRTDDLDSREFFYKVTDEEAKELLKDNTAYKKLFP